MKKYKVYGEILDFIGIFVCDSLEEAEEIGKKYAMAVYKDFEGTNEKTQPRSHKRKSR